MGPRRYSQHNRKREERADHLAQECNSWFGGINKTKHCRRIATRYDKLAANYLAFVQLASIRLWLRVNESTS